MLQQNIAINDDAVAVVRGIPQVQKVFRRKRFKAYLDQKLATASESLKS